MMGDPVDHLGQIEQGEDVALELDVARDIGADQAELARSPQQPTQAPTVDEDHRGGCIAVTCYRPVPALDPDRQRPPGRRLKDREHIARGTRRPRVKGVPRPTAWRGVHGPGQSITLPAPWVRAGPGPFHLHSSDYGILTPGWPYDLGREASPVCGRAGSVGSWRPPRSAKPACCHRPASGWRPHEPLRDRGWRRPRASPGAPVVASHGPQAGSGAAVRQT